MAAPHPVIPSVLFRLTSELGPPGTAAAAAAEDGAFTVAGDADRLGRVLFAALARGGAATQVVVAGRPWDCHAPLFEAARRAASGGLAIERWFLLADRHLRVEPSLREHHVRDAAAGIRTRAAFVGDLVGDLAASSPGSLEFGLWDDAVCTLAVHAGGGLGPWRVAADAATVRRAHGVLALLRKKALAVDPAAPATPPRGEWDPVAASAPLARRLAATLCRRDAAAGEGCAWYHGFWQYLRVLGLVTAPAAHGDFLQGALRRLAGDGGFARVLVSGSADYAMLAHVLSAYRAAATPVEVTMVDRCATPLHLAQWYADAVGAPVETVVSDILAYHDRRPFDVICTHSFLGYFTPAGRRSLIATWRRLLRPGGKVITVNRVRPSAGAGVIRFTRAQARALSERALEEARKWRDFLDIEPEQVAAGVALYGRRFRIHPVRSRDEILALFADGGFTVEDLDASMVPGAASQETGPSTPGGADYVRVLATRRR